MRGDHRLRELGVTQRGGAEDRPLRARVEHGGDRGGVPQPTADLDGHGDRPGDPAHVVEVGGHTPTGAVEVHDVQRASAVIHPPQRGVERVGVVDGLLIEFATRQSHRVTVADVDRRPEDHARAGAGAQWRANPRRSASPCPEDFSG
jgi:hypothetical protein